MDGEEPFDNDAVGDAVTVALLVLVLETEIVNEEVELTVPAADVVADGPQSHQPCLDKDAAGAAEGVYDFAACRHASEIDESSGQARMTACRVSCRHLVGAALVETLAVGPEQSATDNLVVDEEKGYRGVGLLEVGLRTFQMVPNPIRYLAVAHLAMVDVDRERSFDVLLPIKGVYLHP